MKKASFRRIIELDRMVRQGKLKSASAAAEHFGVTQRTIERDLEELRHELGAQLKYNRTMGCYEYEGDPVTLPAQWMNERELAILLIAERALREHAGTSFHGEIHPAFNKLLNPVRHDRKMMASIRDLAGSVHFYHPAGHKQEFRQEFSIILDSILLRKRISFRRQEMDPYALVNEGDTWYVVGYCRKSRKEKRFLLADIPSPKMVDHYFAIPRNFDVKKFM
jgi:predicted DNA-binding transcriptional regulator YafY